MPIHYRVQLACEDCLATITYEDQRPDWHMILPDPQKIAEAEAWLRDHSDDQLRLFIAERPVYTSWACGWHLVLPPVQRYVTCPACDGRAFPADTPDDAETALESAS